MLQCWRRMGHLPSFFVPTPGDLTAQESPPPGICHPRQKKCLMPGGQPGGGRGLGAGGIDWCITAFFFSFPVLCLSLTVLIFVIGLAIFFLVEYLYPGSALRYMLCRKGSLDGTATFTYIPFGDRAQVFFGSSGLICSLLVEEIAKLQSCQVSLFVDFCKRQKFLI